MSVALLAEVVTYLSSPDCPLTAAERLTLMAIAYRAGDETREAWQGGPTDWNLARIVGVRMPEVFSRLADHGIEVRVQLGTDSAGRAVYAYRGRQMSFRLPHLPTTIVGVHDTSLTDDAQNGSAATDPLAVDNESQCSNGSAATDPLAVDNCGDQGGMGTPQRTHTGERVRHSVERVRHSGPLSTNQEKISSIARIRALADLGVTEDEEKKIISRIRQTNSVKNISAYIAAMVRNGDITPMLDEIREPMRRAESEAFVARARHMPQCIHLMPGGDQIHPVTRLALCPGCRSGAGAYEEPPKTAPIERHSDDQQPSAVVLTMPGSSAAETSRASYADLGGHGFCIECAKDGHFVVAVDPDHGSCCQTHSIRQEATA